MSKLKLEIPKGRDRHKKDMLNWNPLEQFILDHEPQTHPDCDNFQFALKEALTWVIGQIENSDRLKEVVVCSPDKNTPKVIQLGQDHEGNLTCVLDDGTLWRWIEVDDEGHRDWSCMALPDGALQR